MYYLLVVCVCLGVFGCVWVSVKVCVCGSVCVWVSVFVFLGVCVCVSHTVCVWVSVFVFLGVRAVFVWQGVLCRKETNL